MARDVKRSVLVTRVRQYAGMENSTFATDVEIQSRLDESFVELFDLLTSSLGNEYFLTTAQVVVGPTGLGQLAFDFYRLLAARCFVGGQFYEMVPFSRHNVAELLNEKASSGTTEYVYRTRGVQPTVVTASTLDYIEVFPRPVTTLTVELDYIPYAGNALNAGDVTYPAVHGWEAFMVADVVAQLLAKEESDPSYWLQKKAEARARILAVADTRDAGRPECMTNVRRPGSRASWGWR